MVMLGCRMEGKNQINLTTNTNKGGLRREALEKDLAGN